MDAKINAILDQCLKALPFINRPTLDINFKITLRVWVIVECRGSRVRGRGSRVRSRRSRVRSRGSQVEGRRSRVASRGSHVEGCLSRVERHSLRVRSRGRESKVKGQNVRVCMFFIVLKNEVFLFRRKSHFLPGVARLNRLTIAFVFSQQVPTKILRSLE